MEGDGGGLLWDEQQVEGQLVLPNLYSPSSTDRDKRVEVTVLLWKPSLSPPWEFQTL